MQSVLNRQAMALGASVLTFALALLLGCGGRESIATIVIATPTPTPLPTRAVPELVDTYWELESLNGGSLIEGTRISIAFAEEYLSGSMTCNRYGGGPDSGRYLASSQGVLAVAELAVTVRLCTHPEDLMDQERTYIDSLRMAARYRLSSERLEISDATGRTRLVFARSDKYACADMPAIEAQSVGYESIEALVAHAGVIVNGTVVDIDVVLDEYRGRLNYWAVHTLKISKVFKGSPAFGETSHITAGTRLGCKQPGGEYILFLPRAESTSSRPPTGFDDPEKHELPAQYNWPGPSGEFLIKGGAVFSRDTGLMARLYPPGTAESDLVEDIVEAVETARSGPGVGEPTPVPDFSAINEFLKRLEERGLKATELDIGRETRVEPCLDAPRRSYELDGVGRLHVFLYASGEASRLAAEQVPPDADCNSRFDWAYDVRYFLYGEAIVFLASEDANVLKALEDLSGPAFACGPGPGRDLVSSCPR